jgi:hypothetical protein
MRELSEVVAELLSHFNTDKDKTVQALQAGAQPVYQKAFDAGHGEGLKRGRQEKADVDAKVASLTAELATANEQLTELRDKTPDVQKVRDQYDRQITDLKDKHTKELAKEREKRETADMNRELSKLEAKLGKRLDPLAVKALMVDPDLKKRLQPKGDGSFDVMQHGKDIPFSPGEGQDALDLLADELTAKQDPKWRLANTDTGSGVEGQGTGGGGGADPYAKIRERKDAELKQESAAGIKPLREKLGMKRPSTA